MQRVLILLLSLSLTALPSIAAAQPAQLKTLDAVKAAAATTEHAPPARNESRGPAVVTGALIGAGAALLITGWAAASYGENEGGKFCYPCMLQWSALSVPVGAGLGAGIGFAVASVRHSAGPSGPRQSRQASIPFSTRF